MSKSSSSSTFWVGGLVLLAVVIVISALASSYTSVNQQDRGVVLRNGKLVGVAEPGPNWFMPFVTDVVEVPVTGQNKSYPKLQAYSQDQQVATMNVSVSFSVPPGKVAELYSQFGNIDNLVARTMDRQVPQAMENVFGQYNAISAVQQRERLVADLNISVKDALKAYPIMIESVQLENVSFSDDYDAAVSARMNAEVNVAKKRQELESAKVDAQIQVTNAQAAADSQLAEATARAKGIRLSGEAEAAAIKAKSDALNDSNPSLVAYTWATRWNGVGATTVLPNSSLTGVQLPGQK